MRKAEFEEQHRLLQTHEDRIREQLAARAFSDALVTCQNAFAHIVVGSKFREQNSAVSPSDTIWPIAVICRYAPPLFEHASIEALLEFVIANRYLSKHPRAYRQMAEAALRTEEAARVLWLQIERERGILQHDLCMESGVTRETVSELVAFWTHVGILACHGSGINTRLSFHSRLDDELQAVCHHCGAHGAARREILYKETACKRCGFQDHYFIKYP